MPGGWGILGSSGLRQKVTPKKLWNLENYVHRLAKNSLTMDDDGNVDISGILNIATTGELQQGTGTLGVDYTGLRIWNDAGIGRIGGYASDTLQWYANTDGKLYAGGGNVVLDTNGVVIAATTAYEDARAYKFTSGGAIFGGIYAKSGVGEHWINVGVSAIATETSAVIVNPISPTTYPAYAHLSPQSGSVYPEFVVCADDNATITTWFQTDVSKFAVYNAYLLVGNLDPAYSTPGIGDVELRGSAIYAGNLKPYRNSTLYTGYVYVPLTTPLTSTSWDGDAYSTQGTSTQIDLSAVFGLPANIKAVAMTVGIRDSGSAAATDIHFACGPSSTYWYALLADCAGLANDSFHNHSANVPCDANGDVWYRILASGVDTMDIWIRVWGYFL